MSLVPTEATGEPGLPGNRRDPFPPVWVDILQEGIFQGRFFPRQRARTATPFPKVLQPGLPAAPKASSGPFGSWMTTTTPPLSPLKGIPVL